MYVLFLQATAVPSAVGICIMNAIVSTRCRKTDVHEHARCAMIDTLLALPGVFGNADPERSRGLDMYVISLRRKPKLFENVSRQMHVLQKQHAMRDSPITVYRFDAIDMTNQAAGTGWSHDQDKMRTAVATIESVRDSTQGPSCDKTARPMPITTNALYTMTKYNNMRRYHYQISRLGTIGCYLSHVSVWKRVADTNKPAIIAEDDHYIADMGHAARVLGAIAKAQDSLAQSADVVLITYLNLRNNTDRKGILSVQTSDSRARGVDDLQFLRVNGEFWGLQLYMLTPRGARLLLKDAFPIEMQVDAYMGMRASSEVASFSNREAVRVYALDRPMSFENNIYGSSAQADDNCSFCDLMYDREVGQLIQRVLPEAYAVSGGGPGSTKYQASNDKISNLIKRTTDSIMSIYDPLRNAQHADSASSVGLYVPANDLHNRGKVWLTVGIITFVVGIVLCMVAVILFVRR